MAQLLKRKCLNELQREATSIKLENRSTKQIISSADKLYAEAEKQLQSGDEELSYIFFFRYMEAIGTAQKKEDYKKDKTHFDKLISKNKFINALEKLEVLTSSLQKRYDLCKQAEDLDTAAKKKEFSDALENQKNLENREGKVKGGLKDKQAVSSENSLKTSLASLNGVVKANGIELKDTNNNGISPHELKILLEQKTKRILLVDCRDQTDFANNHINHSNSICIPTVALTQGMSANKIQCTLKECSPESYMDWNKRGTFDYIILYDWNSSFDHRAAGLNIVYDALTKWDQDCKNTKILVVQGGMKNMYYTYPNLLTHPQTNVNAASKLDDNNETDLRKLELISYPDLDDTLPKPKSNSINTEHQAVPSMNSNTNNQESVRENIYNPDVDIVKNGVGRVDRSTKPTRYISPTRKLPNGTLNDSSVMPSPRPDSANERSGILKTDITEYSTALDNIIESAKNALKSENQLKDLKLSEAAEKDAETQKLLKAKEAEMALLQRQLESRNEQVKDLKARYEAAIREQKAKHILPKIRTSVEEEEIAAKQLEKEKLDEMIKELQKTRVEDAEKNKREQLMRQEKDKSNERDYSRLPPIENPSGGTVSKTGSGTNRTQLPVINNSIPTEIKSGHSSITKPSSSTVASSRSVPVSQETANISRQKLKDENLEPPRSSALKRSHSHPNIAQSHDEDMGGDLPGSSQVPRINRGLKPAGSRSNVPEVVTPRRFARNFEVVSSTEKSKTGLKNLGNTCYMNSIIQCLSQTNKLVNYLRNEEYIKEWHPARSLTKGEATEELAAAVKQIHSGHRSISLLDLKSTIGKYHRSFRGYEQQDSHEFITILLDWLHEEMNRVPEKTPLKEQTNDGLTDEIAALRAWNDYKRSNDSKISELFCGQQKSCVTCASCSRESVTFEPFFILSVPIPSSGKKCDIQQCIDFYTTEEELSGWNCVHCKKKVRATKKIDLWRLPPYLIIHLQRFYFDGYWKKRLTDVDFPVENLNLNQKVLERTVNDKCPSYDYQLYGVSNHYGSMDGGHYTAYCRLNGWWKFDDQEVCATNSRDVSTAAAYILFYQNRNC